jgi:hypothetical protein
VPVLVPGSDAMTLVRVVLIRRSYADDEELIAHELVHVRQWADLGIPRFLTRYLSAYARNLLATRRHRQAYLDIPLEVEARAEAAQWAERHASP